MGEGGGKVGVGRGHRKASVPNDVTGLDLCTGQLVVWSA